MTISIRDKSRLANISPGVIMNTFMGSPYAIQLSHTGIYVSSQHDQSQQNIMDKTTNT